MRPEDTARLRFREMVDSDLDVITDLLADPQVMVYYPAPKTRAEAQDWIDWNKDNYVEYGFGLWIIETPDGIFVGDCGLTWQTVGGVRDLEVGYHVRADLQGSGYATEAALACVALARLLGFQRLTANIDAENLPSRRVAEKVGLPFERIVLNPRGKELSVHAAAL